MKKVIAALCLLSTPAYAETMALDCKLNINGQADWNFSVDFDTDLFTAYRGSEVVRRRSQVTVERQYGSSLTPKADGVKFLMNISPMESFIYYRFTDKTAYVMPMSGSNPRAVGTCQDGKFRGL